MSDFRTHLSFRKNIKTVNSKWIRYSDTGHYSNSHLSLTQIASCNFKFLPSTCLSTTNFHTYNIIQMEVCFLNTEVDLYHVTQWRHSRQQFIWYETEKFNKIISLLHTLVLKQNWTGSELVYSSAEFRTSHFSHCCL